MQEVPDIRENKTPPDSFWNPGAAAFFQPGRGRGSRSEERLLLRDVFARDHTEGQSVKHSDRSEAGCAMDTARDFAAGVEARNRLVGLRADHLSLGVDQEAAHRVMDLRGHFNAVERGLRDVEAVVELQNTVEVLILTILHEAIEALHFLKERILLDAEVISEFRQRLSDKDGLRGERSLHEGRVDRVNDSVVADGDRVVLIRADHFEFRVALDLAAGVFIHEALAGLLIHHHAEVHAGVVREVHRHAEAVLMRVAIGEELQPGDLKRGSADFESLQEHAGSGARLVRGVSGRHNARILDLTEPDVAGETASREHHSAAGAVDLTLAGLILDVIAREIAVEAIAFAADNTHHAAVLIHHEVVKLRAALHLNVLQLREGFIHRDDVPGAGTSLDFIGTRNRVAAFKQHLVRHEFSAAVLNKLHRVVAAVNENVQQFGVVDAEAILQAVLDEELAGVLDALSLLNRIHRAGHVAAADRGVAAEDAHLLNHENGKACLGSLISAGHAGETGAHDHDVIRGIKLGVFSRNSGLSRERRSGNGCGSGGAGFQKISAASFHRTHDFSPEN